MHVVSTNFAKMLVCKRENDVTNSLYPVTMTTIGLRHCSPLEFGRGASNQATAPGITRPLHAAALDVGQNSASLALPFKTEWRTKTVKA